MKEDDIVGTVTVDFGDEPREFDCNAKRAVEVDDVLGVWDLRLETPNGVIEPRLTITKADKEKEKDQRPVETKPTEAAAATEEEPAAAATEAEPATPVTTDSQSQK